MPDAPSNTATETGESVSSYEAEAAFVSPTIISKIIDYNVPSVVVTQLAKSLEFCWNRQDAFVTRGKII